MIVPSLHVPQLYPLASMAAWLSSIAISHHNLLLHIPSICLQSTAAHSPWYCSTIPKFQLPATVPSMRPASLFGVCMALSKGCLILIPFRLPQLSCFSLSLKCFSPDSDNCLNVVMGPLFQFPHPPRAGPVFLTLLFFPLVSSFYRVSCDSMYFVH